jgi:hypothetical protein
MITYIHLKANGGYFMEVSVLMNELQSLYQQYHNEDPSGTSFELALSYADDNTLASVIQGLQKYLDDNGVAYHKSHHLYQDFGYDLARLYKQFHELDKSGKMFLDAIVKNCDKNCLSGVIRSINNYTDYRRRIRIGKK